MKLSDLLIENNSVIMEKATPNDALPAFQIAETTKPDKVLLWIKDSNGGYSKYIVFKSAERAQKFAKRWTNNPDRFKDFLANSKTKSRIKDGPIARASGKIKTADALIDQVKNNLKKNSGANKVSKIIQSPTFRAMTSILGKVGFTGAAFYGVLGAINDVEVDPNLSPEEKEEQIDILWGSLTIQLLLIWSRIARNATLVTKAISGLKTIVRSAQLAAAGTGVGTVPAVVSFIISEAAFWAVGAALASPAVQRAFAEWVSGTILGSWIGFVGGVAGPVLTGAGRILDSVLGDTAAGKMIKDFYGFEEGQERGGREGEMYASTEWAKLTFSHLLFPDAAKAVLVPYISPARREDLMFNVLKITEGNKPNNNTQPDATDPNATNPDATDPVASSSNSDAVSRKADIERSLQNTNYYNNPSYTRAQPVSGPR